MNECSRKTKMLPFLMALGIAMGLPFSMAGQAPSRDDTEPSFVPNELIILLDHGAGAPAPEEVVQSARLQKPLPGGLGIGSPQSVRFALTRRATGRAREEMLAEPDSPRARLERYLVMTFPGGANLDAIEAALLRNPHVLTVERNRLFKLHVSSNDPLFPVSGNPTDYQWGSHALGLPGAWEYAKGHSYLGLIDTGLQVNHPDLRAFDGSTYVGGNFRPHMSWDLAQPASCHTNQENCVDEMEEGGFGCGDPGGVCVGHGTHTSGIMAATANNGTGVAGACWNCGLLMVRRGTTLSNQDLGNSLLWLVEHGVQAISMSFGREFSCFSPPSQNFVCDALDFAERRDVLMTASAGNDKLDIEFPASDPRVMSIGGIESSGAFWDRADEGGCPCAVFPGVFSCSVPTLECGSNYTVTPGSAQQDLVAPAKEVLSTFYENRPWNFRLGCHDRTVGGVNHAGIGYDLCTGTSMSSPYVAAIGGILRSVNPLLTKAQIESALTGNASRAGAWDSRFGYGTPNAEASVHAVLGRVNGVVVPNRLTPLFGLYSSVAEDHFFTTFPQMGSAAYWSSDGYIQGSPVVGAWPDVPGYGYFPDTDCDIGPCLPEAGASVYVFTTDRSPSATVPLVPLYRMSFEGTFPGGPSNPDNRDHTYTTDGAGIEAHAALGYRLDGIEGYIYQRCIPETSCIPAGAVRLYRYYNATLDDWAIFPESELADWQTNGYGARLGYNAWIGYVYPNLDSDSDQVIDGFEALMGTKPQSADSDCDGLSDGAEVLDYPYADPGGPDHLNLSNQTIATTHLFSACRTLTASTNFVVGSGGDVTFHAVDRVALGPGFRISSGGQLKVVVP